MYIRSLLFLVLSFIVLGCESVTDCTEGNNILTKESRKSEPYHSVKVEGSFEVILVRGTDSHIQIEADSNLHSQITTTVNRGELIIESTKCFSASAPVRVLVTAPAFRSLEVHGSGSITSQELISADDEELLELSVDGSGSITLDVFAKMVKSDIDGSGTINLKGTTEGQVVTVEGSGKYLATKLQSNETVANLSGSGEINVHSTGSLTVENSGSGIVRYKGSPAKLSSDISGSGKVVQE